MVLRKIYIVAAIIVYSGKVAILRKFNIIVKTLGCMPEINEVDIDRIRALSDPQKLKIIRNLKSGPKFLSELVDSTGIPRSTLVYHISFLEKQIGLVESDYEVVKENSVVVAKKYTMDKDKLEDIQNSCRKISDEVTEA